MAIHVSPGVYWREIDRSQYIQALSTTQFGMVSTAPKGPMNSPTLITSPSQFLATFGTPSKNHIGMYAALEYLKAGSQLFFVRVESKDNPASLASTSFVDILGNVVPLEAKDTGSYYNGYRVEFTHNFLRTIFKEVSDEVYTIPEEHYDLATLKVYLTDAANSKKYVVSYDLNKKEFVLADNPELSAGLSLVGNHEIHFDRSALAGLDTMVEYKFPTSFNIEVYRKLKRKEILVESFRNLTFLAEDNTFYEKVLPSSVIFKPFTLQTYPKHGMSVVLNGGTDGLEGIKPEDYIGYEIENTKTGLRLLEDPEALDLNCVAVPGITDKSIAVALTALAEGRKDCVALIDSPFGMSPQDVVDWADGKGKWEMENSINSSYAAIFYPWVKIKDSYIGEDIFIPPSGFEAAAFAISESHEAPAGLVRGKLTSAIGVERILNLGYRDFLYQNRINPISDFAASGVMIYGQKTAQTNPSALDRLNVRRLLIEVEKAITTSLMPFVFEPNTPHTRDRMVKIVNGYLKSRVARGHFYEAQAFAGKEINTPDVIDRNELQMNIVLRPVKTAEIITLNFIVVATGASINEYAGPMI
jgi:phage tail sheath protein FI